MPIFRIFRSEIAGNSLGWPSNALTFSAFTIYNVLYTRKTILFLHSLFIIYCIRVRQYKHVLDEYDDGSQQNPPFPKLHIQLLEQFEGSRTFTTLSNPCSQKIPDIYTYRYT